RSGARHCGRRPLPAARRAGGRAHASRARYAGGGPAQRRELGRRYPAGRAQLRLRARALPEHHRARGRSRAGDRHTRRDRDRPSRHRELSRRRACRLAGAGMSGLRVQNLSARYGRIEVCRRIDLAVDAGELLLMLGPNGAGKSSLLGALSGSVSSNGEVMVGDRPLHNRSAAQRAKLGISLVPEGRRNIFGPLSVMENLQLGLRLLPIDQRTDMLKWLFGLFPVLQERRQQQASLLSGGEQQMLAIAMAVARRPAALLLDEPSQGLAPVVLEQLA